MVVVMIVVLLFLFVVVMVVKVGLEVVGVLVVVSIDPGRAQAKLPLARPTPLLNAILPLRPFLTPPPPRLSHPLPHPKRLRPCAT